MKLTANPALPLLPPAKEITAVEDEPKYVQDIRDEVGQIHSFLNQFRSSILQLAQDVHHDISLGKSRHQLMSGSPTSAQIDEGEIRFRTDGDKRLYVRMSGTMMFVNLTSP